MAAAVLVLFVAGACSRDDAGAPPAVTTRGTASNGPPGEVHATAPPGATPATGLAVPVVPPSEPPAGTPEPTVGGPEPAPTTSPTAPGDPAVPTDVPAGPGLSTEGACGWLGPGEVQAETGIAPDAAAVVRGGCRWTRAGTAIVDLEVRDSAGTTDLAAEFAAQRAEQAPPGAPGIGIGEDSFLSALDAKVYWLQRNAIYAVWVETVEGRPSDQQARTDVAVALARLAAPRIG